MTIKEFQKLSTRTVNQKLDSASNVMNCLLGMSGETGEVLDIFKKHIYQGHEFDIDHVKEELGDIMYYIVNLATLLNLDMEDILAGNVVKLIKRFPNGFTENESIRRLDHDTRN